jgi:hypothetical protein
MMLNVVYDGRNSVMVKAELGHFQDFSVFGQDTGINAQSQVAGSHHTQDTAARTEG